MKSPNNRLANFWRRSFRPLAPGETDEELLLAGLIPIVTLLIGAWVVLGLPLPKCLLHEWTGIPCVTCGSTRALGALSRGDWLQALRWNPGMLVGGVFLGIVWGYAVVVCGLRRHRFRPNLSPPFQNGLRTLIFLLLLANWIYLLLTLP